MALFLKFKVKESADRLSVIFSEFTGEFSSANLGGWGSPNPAVGDAVTATVIFTRRGETTNYSFVIPAGFPNIDPAFTGSIPYTEFGGAAGEKIPNDIWHIQYVVAFASSSAQNDFYFSLVGGLKCCISQVRQTVPIPRTVSCQCRGMCICEWKEIKCITALGALYDSICPLVAFDKLNRTAEVISYLQRYCDSNCKSGC